MSMLISFHILFQSSLASCSLLMARDLLVHATVASHEQQVWAEKSIERQGDEDQREDLAQRLKDLTNKTSL